MTLVFAGQGLGKRDNQEDGYRVERQNDSDPGSDVLMLLADGMGGHEGGEIASEVALDAFLQHFLSGSDSPRPRERLSASLHRANEAIAERVAQSPELAGMGCTLIGCLKLADRLVSISVGDSVIYLFRQGKLRRLNADHSVYGEMRELVAQGKLSQADADRHPRRNALRSAVVGGELPLIDLGQVPLEPGDVVLLASDGLETLREEEIERTIRDGGDSDPERIGETLLAAVESRDRPSQDNTTVLVVRHDDAAPDAAEGISKWVLPPAPAPTPAAPPATRPAVPVVVAGGLLVALAGLVLLWALRPDDALVAAPAVTDAPAPVQGPR